MTDRKLFITPGDVAAGDVLLCYTATHDDDNSRRVAESTGSRYTHAAIALGENAYGEITDESVSIESLTELIGWSDHIAVFRQPCWNDRRKVLLRRFIEGRASKQCKFNYRGAAMLENAPEKDDFEILCRLHEFFDGSYNPRSPIRPKYFCSELVAAAFIAVGILDKSASVAYPPEKISPIALSKDPTYGIFCGYLLSSEKPPVPKSDQFYNETTLAEIEASAP